MTENVYEKARQVLRERGWRKGSVGRGNGAVCLLGAIGRAAGVEYDGHIFPIYDAAAPFEPTLLAVLKEQYPEDCVWSVSDWNDGVATSAAQVDAVLDKAARIWDEQVQP